MSALKLGSSAFIQRLASFFFPSLQIGVEFPPLPLYCNKVALSEGRSATAAAVSMPGGEGSSEEFVEDDSGGEEEEEEEDEGDSSASYDSEEESEVLL